MLQGVLMTDDFVEATWVLEGRYKIKPGAYNFRECEHCGERVYNQICKLVDLQTGDTMFVDEACLSSVGVL